MGGVNSNIAFIQNQCSTFSNVSAEGLMFGVANIMTMKPKLLEAYLEENGCEDKEKFAAEKDGAAAIIKKAGLNLELIKQGSTLVLPFFRGDENSAFFKGLNDLKEPVDFCSIVSYIIDSLDEEYLKKFQEDKSLSDIIEYREELKTSSGRDNSEKNRHEEFEFTEGGVVSEDNIVSENEEETPYNNDYYLKKYSSYLETLNLERKQIESITARVKVFTESLVETGNEKLAEETIRSLISVDGAQEVIKAHALHLKKLDDTDRLAQYKIACHEYMRNLWQCLEDCKEKIIPDGNKLLYLTGKYGTMYGKLTEKILGQDYAVNEFVQTCFDTELYEEDPNHPQAVFLFAGPPGVGKTFLAQSVADILERPFMMFDMASYSTEKSDVGLIGSETNFKNAGEGTLVGFVEDNPDAILLFDEIEKAHPDVTRLFLSIIEGARLENKLTASNTDFSKTILIFTTNAGRAIYEDNKKNLSATPTDVIIKELRKEKSSDGGQPKIPPELCSRFASQHIIMFNHIGISDMVKLIVRNIDETCRNIEEKLRISVEYDKRLALLFLMHSGAIDVRVVTGQAQQYIRREVYELSRHLARIKDANAIKKICFSIDNTRISDKVKAFFSAADSEEATLAVVCDEKTRKKFKSIQHEHIKISFIESEEKLLECDPDDITAFIVDPYYSMYKVNDRILGLDDYDSVGLRIIKTLLQKKINAPIFILEDKRKISPIDKTTFFMKGVENTVCIDGRDPSDVVTDIVSEQLLQKKCSAMLNRRKVFDFETLQEMPDKDGVVNIRFYDIIIKDSVNPEDRDLLINIEERPNVKFEDVIGADNAKAELGDFIKYIENPREYMKYALAVPKGILLYGPPGTGKTMLAKALAGETDATFISISAAKLRSSGEASVERLFTIARKYAPAIVFIDEVDAIAHRRMGSSLTSYDESLLNMFLTQMDGFEQHDKTPVFVVAATNFSVESSENPLGGGLDPAFLRRFGNKILVDQPNKDEKLQFLAKKLKDKGVSVLNNCVTEDGMKNVVERTPGESLAILENILELSFRNAARIGKQLDDKLLDEAMEEYYYGEKKTRDEKQIYRTAVHEASHAYIYSLSGKTPTYLTVISRGDFGGYMQQEDEENKATISKEEFLWSIRTSLAGRVGEIVVFGDDAALNTGASADLRKASSLALNMITSYGMQEGHLFSISTEDLLRSNLMPVYVENAEKILKREEKECFDLVEKGKNKIIAMAKALIDKEHLTQKEISEILAEK